MRLQARDAVNLLSGERRPAAELPRVVAMAGIGHPPRFFATLEKLNVEVVQEVAFADHQEYQQPQLTGLVTAEQTLLMTEKDAVKCRAFAQPGGGIYRLMRCYRPLRLSNCCRISNLC